MPAWKKLADMRVNSFSIGIFQKRKVVITMACRTNLFPGSDKKKGVFMNNPSCGNENDIITGKEAIDMAEYYIHNGVVYFSREAYIAARDEE